ncbi:MAG TPA: hypothetical protein VJU61_09340, partial [Polyangiaceae bacterium]|nr:hypothetical protein [Polyangiaceae bacterium]
DDENPFEVAEGFNLRQRWMRQLSRLVPVWAAAWIDGKTELDRAYRAVLAVEDPERRRRLLFRLSDLPIELPELTPPVTASVGVRDPRLVAARDRIDWSERFRNHYRDVLRDAKAGS